MIIMKKKNLNVEGHDSCKEEEGCDEDKHDEEYDESHYVGKTMQKTQ